MLNGLKSLVTSWVIERMEPEIQGALERWMRTPEGKLAIADIMAELTADAFGPASADDSLFVDFLCRLVGRFRNQSSVRRRLLEALGAPAGAPSH